MKDIRITKTDTSANVWRIQDMAGAILGKIIRRSRTTLPPWELTMIGCEMIRFATQPEAVKFAMAK